MKKSDFDGLLSSLNQAKEFALTGKKTDVRIHLPKEFDVAKIRAGSGLTQVDFCTQIGVSVATLRNWEQGRRSPEGPARVLLALLAKDPNIVQLLLKSAA